MIHINTLNKFYPLGKKNKFHALKNINLVIKEGEFVSIEGQSGAGKSTLLHIIGLLDKHDNGEYLFKDKNIKHLNDTKLSELRNTQIGFVLQDFSLINKKTVLFNVMLPLLFSKKISYSQIKKRAKEALENVGIADQINKKVNQLSGGQKQRVAIARALVINPGVILADEPTGALDTKTSQQIMELLKEVNGKFNITVVIVTHSNLVSDYCDRKIIMADGEIISDN